MCRIEYGLDGIEVFHVLSGRGFVGGRLEAMLHANRLADRGMDRKLFVKPLVEREARQM